MSHDGVVSSMGCMPDQVAGIRSEFGEVMMCSMAGVVLGQYCACHAYAAHGGVWVVS